MGELLALASGIVSDFTITAIRQLRQNDESVWTIFFMIGALILSGQVRFLELAGIFLILTGNIFVLIYEGSNVSKEEKV